MKEKMSSKHSASGPMAGYSFQFYRALSWLADATSEELIGIETGDDISVVEKEGSFIFEQDKHSIAVQNVNPIGDTSKSFWNTLGIWLDLVKNKKLPVKNCRFLMVTNKHVPNDCLIKQISSAESDKDYSLCVAKIHSVSNFPQKIQPLVKKVLQNDDSFIVSLLRQIELVDQECNRDNSALKAQIIENLRIPSGISNKSEEIFHEMLGWVQQAAMRAWYQNKPAIIQGQAFINALDAARHSRIREKKLERSAHLIEVPKDKVLQHRGSVFVKQMILITNDENEINDAVNDFIRASSELLRLSDEGELTPSDLKTLKYDLVDRWKPIRRRNIRIHKDKNGKDIGYHIFDETTNNYLVSIGGLPTEHPYFTRGTYHRLSENLEVGWHSRFEEFFEK